jgi:hypothetical protein
LLKKATSFPACDRSPHLPTQEYIITHYKVSRSRSQCKVASVSFVATKNRRCGATEVAAKFEIGQHVIEQVTARAPLPGAFGCSMRSENFRKSDRPIGRLQGLVAGTGFEPVTFRL